MKSKFLYILLAFAICLLAQHFISAKFTCPDCAVDVSAKATQLQLKSFSEALEKFRKQCGRFPTSQEGLDVITKKIECGGKSHAVFLDVVGKDPWNNDWIFISDGYRFKIGSYGADNKEGGEFSAADLWLSSDP